MHPLRIRPLRLLNVLARGALLSSLVPCCSALQGRILLDCLPGPSEFSYENHVISASSSSKRDREGKVIHSGRSVNGLRLGDARGQVLEIFSHGGKIEKEYTYPECGSRTEIHWLDVALDADGVFVYLRENQVFQIEVATPRFRTIEGITQGSAPENVRAHYRGLRSYVLRYSGSDAVGGRDLIYWVDRSHGISFEMAYNPKIGKRVVHKIAVFRPGADFRPSGCVLAPQEWREMAPYSLEPPDKMASVIPTGAPR